MSVYTVMIDWMDYRQDRVITVFHTTADTYELAKTKAIAMIQVIAEYTYCLPIMAMLYGDLDFERPNRIPGGSANVILKIRMETEPDSFGRRYSYTIAIPSPIEDILTSDGVYLNPDSPLLLHLKNDMLQLTSDIRGNKYENLILGILTKER